MEMTIGIAIGFIAIQATLYILGCKKQLKSLKAELESETINRSFLEPYFEPLEQEPIEGNSSIGLCPNCKKEIDWEDSRVRKDINNRTYRECEHCNTLYYHERF